MKRIIFYLFLFVFGVFSCTAQNSVYAHISLSDLIGDVIVREYNYPITITYFESGEARYFAYVDTSYVMQYKPISDTITVKDFVVDNDTVFFCGVSNNGKGVLGFFDINDFFYGQGYYYVTNSLFRTSQGYVKSFSKTVTVGCVQRHWVSIGETENGLSCVADMQYDNVTGIVSYTTGEMLSSYTEKIFDIALSDNYVITAGFTSYSPDYCLSIRRYSMCDVFNPSSAIQDYSWVFRDNASSFDWKSDEICIEQFYGDVVSVAAHWKWRASVSTIQHEQGVYVGLFYMNIGAVPVSSTCTFQPYGNVEWHLEGLTKPASYTDLFFLLQYAYDSNSMSMQSIVDEYSNALMAGPYIHGSYLENVYFNNISDYNGASEYITVGKKSLQPHDLIYDVESGNGSICKYDADFPNVQVSVNGVSFYKPFVTVTHTGSLKKGKSKTTYNGNIIVDCHN